MRHLTKPFFLLDKADSEKNSFLRRDMKDESRHHQSNWPQNFEYVHRSLYLLCSHVKGIEPV